MFHIVFVVPAIMKYLMVNCTVNDTSWQYPLPDHVCWPFDVEAAVRWGPGSSTCFRLVFLHSCLGAPQTWRKRLVMRSHTHGERTVRESLMSLWAAVVCRQGDTHGTLMVKCTSCCMRFVKAEAFFLRFSFHHIPLHPTGLSPFYCLPFSADISSVNL